MKLSKHLFQKRIDKLNQTLVFHKWYGNPILMNNELFEKLVSFSNNSNIENDTLNEWIEAGFLFIEDFDEKLYYDRIIDNNTQQVLNGSNLERLDLIVSENCNLGCQHCIYYSSNDRQTSKSIMTYITALNAFQEFLVIMRNKTKVNFEIHFGGAEPTTNWALIKKIVDNFPTYLKDNEKITWHINTNLLIINNEIIEYFNKYSFNIYTSLDGLKNSNDKNRVKLGGKGTFDIVVNNIKLLNSINCQIKQVICTITKENINLINNNFIDFLKELEIPHIGIDFDLVGTPNFNQSEVINKLTSLFWYCYDLDITCTGTWLTPFFHIINNDVRKHQFSFCGAMSGENLTVTSKGEVTLCSYMKTKIGKINSIQKMFEDSKSEYANIINSRQPGRDQHCNGCILEGHCAGQCHITRESNITNQGILDKMCDFYRDITIKMLIEYSLRHN